MGRHILTGAPGAGKTVLAAELRARGWDGVDEAATDVIAAARRRGDLEPERDHAFTEQIAALQRERQQAAPGPDTLYDRSPVCTLALARYLGHPVGPVLAAELDRIGRERVYEPQVFLVRPLGFVTPTAARRISYQDALVFEQVHVDAYRELGYELVDVPPASVAERARLVGEYLSRAARPARR